MVALFALFKAESLVSQAPEMFELFRFLSFFQVDMHGLQARLNADYTAVLFSE